MWLPGAAASRRPLLDAACGGATALSGRDLAQAVPGGPRPAASAGRAHRSGRGEGVMGALDGKHALITGGGSGIGAAIARTLAHAGAAVSIAGRRAGPLDEVARSLPRAKAIVGDVTSEADCTAM